MEFIEEILSISRKSDKTDILATLLAVVFFFVGNMLTVLVFGKTSFLFLFICLATIICPLVGFILGMELGKKIQKRKVKFKNTKLFSKLKKSGYLNEFINTINDEIELKNTILYTEEIQGVGLIITKTWFVFIDTKCPIIVKTNDILKISQEISVSNSRDFLSIELKNNKYLRIDELSLDDIKKEIKNKYPNIGLEE